MRTSARVCCRIIIRVSGVRVPPPASGSPANHDLRKSGASKRGPNGYRDDGTRRTFGLWTEDIPGQETALATACQYLFVRGHHGAVQLLLGAELGYLAMT